MRVSVIVAFRDSSESQHRQRLWDFIRHRLEREHDFEIVVGTDDGVDPFNKCVALNRAAAQATGDVFYLLDSDSWVPPANVDAAVSCIETDPDRWWRPWQVKVKLSELHTKRVLELGDRWDGQVPPDWLRRAENRNRYWAAPPLMLHRDLWFAVGGMDERFRGWGHEDDAFGWALRAFYGPSESIPGLCVHLWHPRRGRSGRDFWEGQERQSPNHALAQQYRRAAFTPDAMRELIAGRAG